MATLYKRYIPPRTAAPADVLPNASNLRTASPPDTKRKRERGEDEKAERKAKKLKKKSQSLINGKAENAAPTIVETRVGQELEHSSADIPNTISITELEHPPVDGTVNEKSAPTGDFKHIKNTQKRRKLEKEARKLRKAAQRSGEDGRSQETSAESHAQVDTPMGAGCEPDELVETATTGPIDSALSSGDNEAESQRVVTVPAELEPQSSHLLKTMPIIAVQKSDYPPPTTGSTELTSSAKPAPTRASPDKPKKRRHKLEAVLDQTKQRQEDTAVEDNDDSHLKKFGGIMSKFQTSKQKAERAIQETTQQPEPLIAPEIEKRDLVPFPQPVNEPVASRPVQSALPDWLRAPLTVSNDAQASFMALDLPDETVGRLQSLGFHSALPVQQALIPLLLPPGTKGAKFPLAAETVVPDIAVSAATGSGKTIAYLLPIIEALNQSPNTSEALRALIVVPTRELVTQVAAVAESLSKDSKLSVGIATGATKISDEQQKMMKRSAKYDPPAYKALMDKACRRDYPPPEDSEEFDLFIEEMENWDDRQEQEIQDAIKCLIDHVPTYTSAVDILVCTPGRLLEHLSSTLGFSLVHVEWLILDEADKLLDQQYDGFLQHLDEELSRPRTQSEQDLRETYLRAKDAWDARFEQRVRKVVLSATMTRDIGKLTALKLRRPQMVVVQGADSDYQIGATDGADHAASKATDQDGGNYELPPTLVEYCVPVGDGSDKPLRLVELLHSRVLPTQAARLLNSEATSDDAGSDSDASDSDTSDSESSLSSSDHSSSDDDTDPNDSVSSVDETEATKTKAKTRDKGSKAISSNGAPTVLVFTASTESAERLAHLLRKLRPDWAAYISSLTKTSGRTLKGSKNTHDPVIIIATDRAGRGLDSLRGRRITHVVQYDVPRALEAYVHRVGRSARAGESGEAWTLYTDREARWFVHEIMRAANVKRAAPVERVRVGNGGQQVSKQFAEVLDEMRETVFGK